MAVKITEASVKMINEILDGIKDSNALKTDVALGEMINQNRGNLANMRSGNRKVSEWSILNWSLKAGWVLPHTLGRMLDELDMGDDPTFVIQGWLDNFPDGCGG